MSLPAFTVDGLLPAGDYPMTLEELRLSRLVTGEGVASDHWDARWRLRLVENLTILVAELWHIDIDRIFIDGSFVEDKDHPDDIDGYFECDLRYFSSGRLERDLNALDRHKVWTWDSASRRYDPVSGKAQLPMWHRYRVELYPHFGQPSGIVDEFGYPQQFPAAFRKTRYGHRPKGIVQIVKSEVA